MTIEEIILTMQTNCGSKSLEELRLNLRHGTAKRVGVGEMSAREAAATFRIRQGTTEKAGVDTAGFADVLKGLDGEPPDKKIALFHFKAPGKVFTVFSVDTRLVGCVRVREK